MINKLCCPFCESHILKEEKILTTEILDGKEIEYLDVFTKCESCYEIFYTCDQADTTLINIRKALSKSKYE